MTECLEFEGKTVAKAIQKAAEKLNLNADSLPHEVLSFGSSGIFGIVGARKARIRVCLADGDRGAPENLAREVDAEDAPVDDSAGTTIESSPTEVVAEDDAAERGREAIERIVRAITTGVAISVAAGDGVVRYTLEGGNLGLIIGKKGQTLEAIHYLVEKIVNKGLEQRVRIYIDVGGYLLNRKQNLSQLAARMAKKARMTGKPTTVGQMSAYDRRIVHMALRDDPSVRTQSVGEGAIRKLVIFPKRRPSKEAARPERKDRARCAAGNGPESAS